MDKEIDNIEDKIFDYIKICKCQRHGKKIIPVLDNIFTKIIEGLKVSQFKDEELLIIALLDRRVDFITHGINIEYPITFLNDTSDLIKLIKKWKELNKH